MYQINRLSNQKGQALLILILMISLVLTVLSAVSYRLSVDTQTTQLQDDAVSALAGADAGIEAGLSFASTVDSAVAVGGPKNFNTGEIGLRTLEDTGIDVSKSQVTVFNQPGDNLLTPEIEKDAQFTYYLVDPNNISSGTSFKGTVTVFFKEVDGDCSISRTKLALEINRINANGTVIRDLVEPCTTNRIGTPGLPVSDTAQGAFSKDTTLNKNISIKITDERLLIIRTLFNKTNLGFKAVPDSGSSIPVQGRIIRSYAVTNSGVSRTVDVFQTLPQLPAEFFVTSL